MTRIRIRKGIAKGVVKIPSSKSYGHRALIAAALAHGQSVISNLNYSKDILATIDVLRVLGAQIDIEGSRAIVNGCNPFLAKCSNVLCEESGSTLRFLIPVFSLGNELHTFMGKGELLKRPQSVYQKLFNEMDAVFLHYCDRIEAAGPLVAGEYHLAGNVSSQFITGLLFAMPLLNGDSILHIEEPFASKSYVSITIDILRRFNIKITMDGNDIFIKGKQKYLPYDYEVEGDYSSAAFFGLLGAINNEISIKGLSPSLQGDRVVFDYLKLVGAHVDIRENEIVVGNGICHGCTFDLNDCPDLGPALMALAAISNETFVFNNIARLKIKESDRVACMFEELAKIGAKLFSDDNKAIIKGVDVNKLKGTYEFAGHNDHRIVMALAIISTVLPQGAVINGAEAVAKSYPDFFKDLCKLGIEVEVVDD